MQPCGPADSRPANSGADIRPRNAEGASCRGRTSGAFVLSLGSVPADSCGALGQFHPGLAGRCAARDHCAGNRCRCGVRRTVCHRSPRRIPHGRPHIRRSGSRAEKHCARYLARPDLPQPHIIGGSRCLHCMAKLYKLLAVIPLSESNEPRINLYSPEGVRYIKYVSWIACIKH